MSKPFHSMSTKLFFQFFYLALQLFLFQQDYIQYQDNLLIRLKFHLCHIYPQLLIYEIYYLAFDPEKIHSLSLSKT